MRTARPLLAVALLAAACRSDPDEPSADPGLSATSPTGTGDSTLPVTTDTDTDGPVGDAPRITPRSPRAGVDELTCTSALPSWWERDGTPTFTEPTVSPWDLAPGTWACVNEVGRDEVDAVPVRHNLVVVLVDDLGIDRLASYDVHPDPTPTPALDALAARALQFEVAYATPLCSPSRAAMLTGKLPRRTGLGWLVDQNDASVDWLAGHPTFAELLRDEGYATAMTGKWHLSSKDPSQAAHPAAHGFGFHRGTVDNPGVAYLGDHLDKNYFEWQDNHQGVQEDRTGYLTSATIDDAIAQLDALPEPWLLYVPLNAPHAPLHWPPESLAARPATIDDLDRARYDAMVTAMDVELDRFFSALDDRALMDRTTLIVLGDNGTQDHAMRAPSDPYRSKKTGYEGGVRVPLWVVSPLLTTPSTTRALVHLTDVFATARDLAGAPDDGATRDTVSLLPYLADPSRPSARHALYTELFTPNGTASPTRYDQTIRNDTHKLLVDKDGTQLFRLDPTTLDEGEPLDPLSSDDAKALAQLQAELAALEATFP